MNKNLSRRQMIKAGLLTAAGTSLIGKASAYSTSNAKTAADDDWQNFKIGVASYTFRKLSVDNTIKAMKRLNLPYISIKDFHLSLDSTTAERKALVQKLKDAGYIDVTKQFKDNYPQTICKITPTGVNAFEEYVKALQEYLRP